MTAATQVPVGPGLFTWPSDEPHLLASRCRACAVVTFPRQSDCPRCTAEDMEDIELPSRGTLWTFTTQEFIPKSPPYAIVETMATFKPYAVGYVEFPGLVKVEGRIDADDIRRLAIDMEMETVVVPFHKDEMGNDVMTFAFRPVTESE